MSGWQPVSEFQAQSQCLKVTLPCFSSLSFFNFYLGMKSLTRIGSESSHWSWSWYATAMAVEINTKNTESRSRVFLGLCARWAWNLSQARICSAPVFVAQEIDSTEQSSAAKSDKPIWFTVEKRRTGIDRDPIRSPAKCRRFLAPPIGLSITNWKQYYCNKLSCGWAQNRHAETLHILY